jgi:hypothetical protein
MAWFTEKIEGKKEGKKKLLNYSRAFFVFANTQKKRRKRIASKLFTAHGIEWPWLDKVLEKKFLKFNSFNAARDTSKKKGFTATSSYFLEFKLLGRLEMEGEY